MYRLVYGNKYAKNEEEYPGVCINDKIMLTATLDFLDTQQQYFLDNNGYLPEDWSDTIFWTCCKI